VTETFERDTSTAWVRAEGLLTRTTPRAVLVATRESAEPIVLEGSAVAIWDELVTPIANREIAQRIAVRTGRSAGDLLDDVAATTHALGTVGAIVGSR
jgi:hypothetical protein